MTRQSIQFVKASDGTRLAYGISGSGPILVKTANWLNHLEFDWESPVWKHWFEFLSSRFTLIRYDERGCGLSDWRCAENDFEAWVEDLKAVADANELERFPLLAISQGCAVAIEFASRYPDRVSHLVLMGGFSLGRKKRGAEENAKYELLQSLIETGWEQDNPAFRQVFASLFIPDGGPEHQKWFTELCLRTANTDNALKIQQIGGAIDVTNRLQQIQIPTLVVHAQRDAMIPVEASRYMASEIPGARFLQLDSANHLLLSDEPAWQHFCDELLHFLQPETSRESSVADNEALNTLTQKERVILELLGQGLSNSAIAEKAFLSEKTIRNHLSNIYSKLGVSTRAEAIVLTRAQS